MISTLPRILLVQVLFLWVGNKNQVEVSAGFRETQPVEPNEHRDGERAFVTTSSETSQAPLRRKC